MLGKRMKNTKGTLMLTTSFDRRQFLAAAPVLVAGGCQPAMPKPQTIVITPNPEAEPELSRALGVTTGSFVKHLTTQPTNGKLVMLDLPKILRDELDMTVLDLMTATLPSLEPGYCEQFRNAAERAGCVITNLKMNQANLDMASADPELRRQSLETYRKTIDAAARLGCRWVRPASGKARPDQEKLASAYRELIDYAGPKGITLLIENNGWIRDDPDAIPQVIKAVGAGLAAQPDTGNWTVKSRYEGLRKAFPVAATCDFKALTLGPGGEHTDYELRKCFDIAWQAGFRGPWCFEHFHESLPMLFKEMARLRDWLSGWMTEADEPQQKATK